MARSRLSGRLAALKQARKKAPPQKEKVLSTPVVRGLKGFTQVEEGVWLREAFFPDPMKFWPANPFFFRKERLREEVVFYDTETTGLSGGAGNIAFLVGFGCYQKDRFRLRQYFLQDYPYEGDFLACLKKDMPPDSLYVSFNGKSFDSHLLKTRFLMNRQVWTIPPQLDLLHPSRRLWKKALGSCSLGRLEEYVLDVQRTGEDVEGAQVPQLYLDYLKTQDAGPLQGVFYHNEEDILSLARLLSRLEWLYAHPDSNEGVDLFRFGASLSGFGREEIGFSLMEEAAEEGDPMAMRFLSLSYKKKKAWERAVAHWKRMGKGDPFALEELAKYYEHIAKDTSKAYELASALAELPGGTDKGRTKRKQRLNRLKNKLGIA